MVRIRGVARLKQRLAIAPALPNYRVKPNDAPAIPEIAVLWMTAGLGCDGDTIAVTAATQPEE